MEKDVPCQCESKESLGGFVNVQVDKAGHCMMIKALIH